MSTQQQKIIREQKRVKALKGSNFVSKDDLKYFQQRLNYPEIYGEMPHQVINKLAELGITKRKR